jgi:hypothetical protein
MLATNAAGQTMPEPNWDPATAAAAVESSDARETLASLFQLAREGQDDRLLAQVRAISEGTVRPGPERDYVLHSLALALGDFKPGVIGPEVLEYLGQTRSLVRVPHEEYPEMGVPLFNIRAAATGSLAEWARLQNGEQETEQDSPFQNVDTFIESLPGRTGPGLATQIRQARLIFDNPELESVLIAAPRLLQSGAASVVLAELSPTLLGRPAVDELLFELLGHADLGSTAALVLGRNGDMAILERLADLAATDEGLSSKRASLALDAHLSTRGGQ